MGELEGVIGSDCEVLTLDRVKKVGRLVLCDRPRKDFTVVKTHLSPL